MYKCLAEYAGRVVGISAIVALLGCGPELPSRNEGSTEATSSALTSGGFHVPALHTYWWFPSNPSGFFNIDSHLRVLQDPGSNRGIYWASSLWFVTGNGLYMGLQDGAQLRDGSIGKIAIFSIWNSSLGNASGATPLAPGGWCQSFGGEGTGSSCRAPYNWVAGHTYRLRIWVLTGDMWQASVQDESTGVETVIGNITAPPHSGYLQGIADNFTENFEQQTPGYYGNCLAAPATYAYFYPPTANAGTSNYRSVTSSVNTDANCSNVVSTVSGGVAIHAQNYGSCGILNSNEGLGRGQVLNSCDGRYTLAMQTDGNLVLYHNGRGALWSTGTWGTTGQWAAMQSDGNFVLYDAYGRALFNTGTDGQIGGRMAVQTDGNLVLYSPLNVPEWNTGTWGR